MSDSIFDPIAKLVSEFSLKQLPKYIVIGILICLAIGFYETYTDQFKLMRLQKITELTEKLAFLENQYNITQNSHLKNPYEELTSQLNKMLSTSSSEFTIVNQKLRFAFAGASVWILFSLLSITAIKNQEKNAYAGIIVTLIFGAIAGIIGFRIPKILNGYFNYFIYPIGNFLLVVGLVMAWYSKKKKPAKI